MEKRDRKRLEKQLGFTNRLLGEFPEWFADYCVRNGVHNNRLAIPPAIGAATKQFMQDIGAESTRLCDILNADRED